MTVSTLSGVISGLQPPTYFAKGTPGGSALPVGAIKTSFYATGFPVAATAPTVSTTAGMVSGTALTSKTGQIPFNNPASGNSYLAAARSSGTITAGNWLILIDRLWESGSSGTALLDRTVTTAQAVDSVTWPARDANGSTNGEGVYIAIEITTTMGTGTPGVTMSYTNSGGTSGKTSPQMIMTPATASSSPASLYVMALAAGDTGVRSIQTITFSATWGTAGVLNLIAFRPIAMIPVSDASKLYGAEDAFTLGMPRLFDNSVLQLCQYVGSTSGTPISGEIGITQG